MVTYSSISAWKIPIDRGGWQATIHGVANSWTQVSDQAQCSIILHKKNVLYEVYTQSIHLLNKFWKYFLELLTHIIVKINLLTRIQCLFLVHFAFSLRVYTHNNNNVNPYFILLYAITLKSKY